VRGSRSSVSE